MKVVDGKGMVLGRLASVVAKKLIMGEEISLVNCSDIVISGKSTMDKFKRDQARGIPSKGPFFSRVPYVFVKKSIRRMLPKSSRGDDALGRIKCYNHFPQNLKDKQMINMEKKELTSKFVTVGKICTVLGGKWK